MKRINLTSLSLSSLIACAAIGGLTSCDALWGTSVDVGTSGPYNSYYGWDGEWLPSLAGAPLISPYYWGGSAYPVSNWQPVYRPGNGPWGNPVGGRPNIAPPNGAIGNLRPGQNSPQPSQPVPSQPSVVPSQPLPNPNGSNPGIQLPPAGMGFQTSQGRH